MRRKKRQRAKRRREERRWEELWPSWHHFEGVGVVADELFVLFVPTRLTMMMMMLKWQWKTLIFHCTGIYMFWDPSCYHANTMPHLYIENCIGRLPHPIETARTKHYGLDMYGIVTQTSHRHMYNHL